MEIYSEKLGKINVDARPSDAIAVAIRLQSPIFVSEEIMDDEGLAKLNIENPKNSANKEVLLLNNLKKRLEEAIKKEEYEIAAELRDQIIKIES